MSRVKCDVSEGPRAGFAAVSVASAEGYDEYLAIEKRFLVRQPDGSFLLPVRLIARDARQGVSLVQLPVEADSGANRVWVRDAILSNTPDEAVA